ncbi:hypothetical protein [Rhodovulum sp. P5]|nr:hypothetical protein [Rhodovulum sp. P5]YP_009285943.1 hypothetical protein BI026_gp58 [Rhodovulum phage vB_RhkS_P1]ANT39929.1 hypothetical protein Rhks_58 [Rhodovulum phage vB_RhkS_P1]
MTDMQTLYLDAHGLPSDCDMASSLGMAALSNVRYEAAHAS